MTQLHQVYKCAICGNMVTVVHASGGELVCCGQPMTLLKENTTDAAKEKHVPVIVKSGSHVTVTVGSVEHPMIDTHYIEFIDLIADGNVFRKFLKPGDKPVAVFEVAASIMEAKAYCNLHGYWKA